MSENKTAEIKFRVTPSEKARWQAAAESEHLGLSSLIRITMNDGVGKALREHELTADCWCQPTIESFTHGHEKLTPIEGNPIEQPKANPVRWMEDKMYPSKPEPWSFEGRNV